MAGPVYRTAAGRSQSGGAVTLTPSKPTVDGQNGLLIAVLQTKNNATHSTATSGWVQIGTQVNSGGGFSASIWAAPESSAAPVFTWSGSVACAAQVAYYVDPANVVDTTIGATTSNNGLTSTHSTSAITTTRGDSLVVYIDVAAADTALPTPSGWTENFDNGSGTDAGRTVFGNKPVATSGSSSGAISETGANAAWVQWQIEVMGQAPAANSFQTSKAELNAWYDPPDGFDVSKAELNAWYDPPAGFDVSKAELAAWLDSTGSTTRRRQMISIN